MTVRQINNLFSSLRATVEFGPDGKVSVETKEIGKSKYGNYIYVSDAPSLNHAAQRVQEQLKHFGIIDRLALIGKGLIGKFK